MLFLFQTHENLGKVQVGLLSMDARQTIWVRQTIGIVSNKVLNSGVAGSI